MAKYNVPPKKNALAKAAEYKPSSSFNQAVKKSSFKKLPTSMSKGFSSKVEGGTGGRPDSPLPNSNFKPTPKPTSHNSGSSAMSFKEKKKAIKQASKLKKIQTKANMTAEQKATKRKNIAKNILSGLGTVTTASQSYSQIKKNIKN